VNIHSLVQDEYFGLINQLALIAAKSTTCVCVCNGILNTV